jgi:hypothetical protein
MRSAGSVLHQAFPSTKIVALLATVNAAKTGLADPEPDGLFKERSATGKRAVARIQLHVQ